MESILTSLARFLRKAAIHNADYSGYDAALASVANRVKQDAYE